MGLFEKKVAVFNKRDKESWEKIKKALTDEGIKFSSGHYELENIPVGGYSAMDPRNFGKGGHVDREIYYVRVKESLERQALDAIQNAGLVTSVDDVETLTQDASIKFKDKKY